jgi:PAS domain S-box-containing protein
VLAFLVPFLYVFYLIGLAARFNAVPSLVGEVVAANAVWLAAAVLSRTRFTIVTGLLLVAGLSLPSHFISIDQLAVGNVRAAEYGLLWLAVPMMAAILALPLATALAANWFNTLFTLGVAFLGFSGVGNAAARVLSFLLVFNFVLSVFGWMLRRQRQMLRAQLTQKAEAEQEVIGLAAELETRVAERTAELSEANETLRAFVESSPAAVVALDREGRVTLWSRAAHELFGWPVGEVWGRPNPLFSFDEQPLLARSFGLGADDRPLLNGEQCVATKEGGDVEVSLSAAPLLDDYGKAVGSIGIFIDLSENRQLEDRLRQAQKMESLGHLAGGVAHDFNNLLTVISGFTSLVLDEMPRDGELREDLLAVHEAAEKASSLTRQLLAFGRRQVLQPEPVDLNELVEGMGKMLRRLIREDIVLEFKQHRGLGLVMADPGQLEQVVVNLVVNARDAMPKGGRLILETGKGPTGGGAPPSLATDVPTVALRVIDTGDGMDEETMSHIFEPFFTTKERGQGTGLGLATVYGIVSQSGGAIEVNSERGKGTTFTVCFPRVDAEQTDEPDRREEDALPAGVETILVIEDEDQLRALTERILAQLGYRVLCASDGQEALLLCRDRPEPPIELIVTDVIMPRLNGPETIKAIRQWSPHMPVLYMSGYSADALADYESGTEKLHFLPKPFSARELALRVRQLLDGDCSVQRPSQHLSENATQ